MKIALITYCDLSMWTGRRSLIKDLTAAGHEVHMICGDGPFIPALKEIGGQHVAFGFPRHLTPLQDIRDTVRLARLLRRERYDIVHVFLAKIIVFGTLAARLARVPNIYASVTGTVSFTIRTPGVKAAVVRHMMALLYRFALPLADRVLFQNVPDRELFVARGFVQQERSLVIPGSGVDTDHFAPQAVIPDGLEEIRQLIGDRAGRIVVIMIGSVVGAKGVREFIGASEILEQRAPQRTLFVLFGDVEPGALTALSAGEVRGREHPGFRWLPWTKHVREAYEAADIVVLPSYREGTPRVLLEAMAMERPIVTTSAPGCAHLVEEGQNGLTVPVGDTERLADAIERLVCMSPSDRRRMGQSGRIKCLEEFSSSVINARIFRELYRL